MDIITEMKKLLETFKNSYQVGDTVRTPLGIGVIVKELEQDEGDVYFAVKIKDSGKTYRLGSFNLAGHVT